MKFKIHFEHPDGTEGSFIVEEETLEQVAETANIEVKKRNGKNPWSEEL